MAKWQQFESFQPGRQASPETCGQPGLVMDERNQHDENVKAIKAAIRDMETGDLGTEMEDHLRRIREEFGLDRELRQSLNY